MADFRGFLGHWPKLRKQFDLMHAWEQYSGPGHWPDADMLPMGKIGLRAEVGEPRSTRFTADEQQTMMTLWSIFRSPLMFGGDLPSNDAATLALISNPEVIAVDQGRSSGGHEAYRKGDTIAWEASGPGSERYVAVFNVGETAMEVDLGWADVGVGDGKVSVRDLWRRQELGATTRLKASLPAHGCVLYLVKPA